MHDAEHWPDSRFVWTDAALTLVPPSCPRGHHLGPRRVLYGSEGGSGARWVFCRACGLEGREQPGQDGRVIWHQAALGEPFRVRE